MTLSKSEQSSTRTIVRIENPEGIGVFRSRMPHESLYLTYDRIIERHRDMKTPFFDPGIEYSFDEKEHICAYKSIDDFRRWIHHDELIEFAKYGFVVKIYEVSDWLEGEQQIVFKRKDVIQFIDVTKLLTDSTSSSEISCDPL